MSAPDNSQILDISLIKEIFVANIALAAYLVISALRKSMLIKRSLLLIKGAYNSRIKAKAFSFSVPTITLSGNIKSSIAMPSFKNSGLLTTSNEISLFLLSNSS